MKPLRQWPHELMHRQFLGGLIVGFLCGAVVVTMAVLWLARDRNIVRAAKLVVVAPLIPGYDGDAAWNTQALQRALDVAVEIKATKVVVGHGWYVLDRVPQAPGVTIDAKGTLLTASPASNIKIEGNVVHDVGQGIGIWLESANDRKPRSAHVETRTLRLPPRQP